MRRLVLVLLLLAVPALRAQPAPTTQILDAEALAAHGTLRLADVLTYLDGVDVLHRDGLRVTARPTWGAPLETERWEIFLDRHRLFPGVVGTRDLNRLPIAAEMLERVEVERRPQLVGGVWAPAGTIRLVTRRVEAPPDSLRVSAFGAYATGNETGDPGPYRFLDSEVRNVDRLGPDVEAGLALARGSAAVRGIVLSRLHFSTDEALYERLSLLEGGTFPRTARLAAALDARYGAHTVWLGASDDGLRGPEEQADFLVAPGAARAVGAATLWGQGSAAGRLQHGGWTGRYRLGVRHTDPRRRPTCCDIDLDYAETRSEAMAEAERGAFTVGLYAESRHLATSDVLTDDLWLAGAAYGRYQHEGWETALHLRRAEDDWLPSGLVARRSQRGSTSYLAQLTYTTRAFADDLPTLFWQRRGWRFFERTPVLGTMVRGVDEPGPSRTLTLDLAAARALAPTLSFTAEARWGLHRGLALLERHLSYEADIVAFSGPATLHADEHGQTASLLATAQWKPSARWRLGASLHASGALSGSRVFLEAGERRPRLGGQARVRWQAAPTFWLGSHLQLRSATMWTDYQDAEEASGGRFDERVGGSTALDLTASKTFWQARLRGTVTVRNVLDREARYLPDAATFPLRLWIRLSARL